MKLTFTGILSYNLCRRKAFFRFSEIFLKVWPGKKAWVLRCWGGRPRGIAKRAKVWLLNVKHGAVQMELKRMGVDTSKAVFTVHGIDAQERAVLRRNFSRAAFEACGGAQTDKSFLVLFSKKEHSF